MNALSFYEVNLTIILSLKTLHWLPIGLKIKSPFLRLVYRDIHGFASVGHTSTSTHSVLQSL
jgi:hypothetical protein